MDDQTKIAWAAGIFDGEGCIHFRKQTNMPVIVIAMTHRETIELFAEIVGAQSRISKYQSQNPKHLASFRLTISHRQNQISVLKKLLPYLVTKRAKAELALLKIQNRFTTISFPNESEDRLITV